jgi:hypothetical protein
MSAAAPNYAAQADEMKKRFSDFLNAQEPAAAAASSKSDDENFAKLGRMFAASMAAQASAASSQPAMSFAPQMSYAPQMSFAPQMQAVPVQMTPVVVGYSYSAPAPAAAVPQASFASSQQMPAAATTQQAYYAQQQVIQQPVVQQPAATMSLVPVQLYRQKSFLGHEKLKPVSVYPYGIR